MTSVRAPEAPQTNKSRSAVTLDQLYGAIGISAVAAALRYCGKAAKPVEAPAASPEHKNADDIAA